jgi:hypothetical protein
MFGRCQLSVMAHRVHVHVLNRTCHRWLYDKPIDASKQQQIVCLFKYSEVYDTIVILSILACSIPATLPSWHPSRYVRVQRMRRLVSARRLSCTLSGEPNASRGPLATEKKPLSSWKNVMYKQPDESAANNEQQHLSLNRQQQPCGAL